MSRRHLSKKMLTCKAAGGSPRPGEIWWAPNLDNIKDRPVLVLRNEGGRIVCRKCTTQFKTYVQYDTIEDYFEAGLEKETYVDPVLRTIPRNRLSRKMGSLTEFDREKFCC